MSAVRHRALLAVLLLSMILNAAGITWGLPSMLGWAADELTPVRVLSGMRQGFADGWHDPYPPFHFYVLAASYAPTLVLDSHPLAEAASEGWRRRPGDGPYFALFLAGRLVSLLMALGTLLAIYRAGLELFDRAAAAWAALVMALSLPFVYYAKVANVDLPFTFWFSIAFVAYLRILRAHRLRDYLLFATTAVLAVSAKDQAYGLFLLPAVHVVVSLARHEGRRLSALADHRVVAAAALGAVVFLLAQGIVFNASGFRAHVEVLTGPMNRSLRMFERRPAGYLAAVGLTARLLGFCLGVPAVLAAVAGLVSAWRRGQRRTLLPILLPPLSYFLFFICAALVVYDRYLMPMCICLSLPAGDFLARRVEKRRALRLLQPALGAAVLVFGVVRALAVDLALLRDSRYAAEQWLAANLPPPASLTVSGPLTHLPRLHGYEWVQRASLRGAQTEFVVLTADYARAAREEGEGGESAIARSAREMGYEPVFRHRTALPWPLDLRHWIRGLEPYTNLHKLNPEVGVLKRPR